MTSDLRKYAELRDGLRDQTSDEDRKQITDYRLVFGSEVGRRVLTSILVDLHFFDGILTTPEEIALSNYARVLLRRCGSWKADNVGAITNSLLSIPVLDET